MLSLLSMRQDLFFDGYITEQKLCNTMEYKVKLFHTDQKLY